MIADHQPLSVVVSGETPMAASGQIAMAANTPPARSV